MDIYFNLTHFALALRASTDRDIFLDIAKLQFPNDKLQVERRTQ